MGIIGIDISKAWFDGWNDQPGMHRRFPNTPTGWQQLLDWSPEGARFIMEASGPYYLALACWLHEQGRRVSVINPLVIRRYGQMRLSRIKTDAKDARLIADYASDQDPDDWQPPSAAQQALQQLMSLREGLLRQASIRRGQQEAFGGGRQADPLVGQLLAQQESLVEEQLERIDQRLQELACLHYRTQLEALQTIPSIGPKTAILLLCITDGFTRFDNARQLASYVGISPRIWQSGSSVKGRGGICKLGSGQLRKLLYMCSWTARNSNPACRQLYERLSEQGKPRKVISIAIAHKLLRQAFAVGTSGQPYDEKKALAA